MAPSSVQNAMKTSPRRTNSSGLDSSHPSPSPATTNSSTPEGPPPAKKAKILLRFGGPKRQTQVEPEEDSIAVASARPQRARKASAALRESQNTEIDLPPPPRTVKQAPSPAPSSGLSSLSSAPPSSVGDDSEREESPFQDEPVSAREAYGDQFTSYYIADGDEPAETAPTPVEPKLEKPKRKYTKRKRAESSSKASPKAEGEVKVGRPRKSAKPPAPRRSSSSAKATALSGAPAQDLPQQSHLPQAQQLPPQMNQGPPPPVQQQQHMPRLGAVHHHGPAPYPQVPMPHQGPRPPAPPPALPPAPVIRFLEVGMDTKPMRPDTIRVMIDKLTSLSDTLKQFGGVPGVAVTPPPITKRPSKTMPKPKVKTKPVAKPSVNDSQLDSFLDIFDASDDSDDSDDSSTPAQSIEPEVDDLNCQLPQTGISDSPLGHGIGFIQNALKSWAQQRMTHQIMTQWNDEQARTGGHFQPQNKNGRPQGRMKKFDVPPGGAPPVVEMNLSLTPEGLAIKKFQSVLDSGCLRANIVIPIELGRALRHLYMQIDSLINQGRTDSRADWYCMSYGAQIAAHQTRVNQWKEAEARRLQEVNRMHQQQHHQALAQMGLNCMSTTMTHEEAERHHAVELERRRSAQHAQQQPYNSQQHLNPLELRSQRRPTPNQTGPSPSPAPMQSHGNGPPGTPDTPDGTAYVDANGFPQRNHLEKVKMYMPGFLPRSGQNMKFSFAPNSADAVRIFGHEAFPSQSALGPQMPNRGPIMDVPRPQSSTSAFQAPVGDVHMTGDVRSRSVSNTAEDAIDLTASDGPQPEQVSARPVSRPSTSNGVVSAFQAINKPPPSQAQPTQDTIEVAAPRPAGKVVLKRQNRGSAKHYPHPNSAVVRDD